MASTDTNDNTVKGLALDMYFEDLDNWGITEEELDAKYDWDLEEAIAEVSCFGNLGLFLNKLYDYYLYVQDKMKTMTWHKMYKCRVFVHHLRFKHYKH